MGAPARWWGTNIAAAGQSLRRTTTAARGGAQAHPNQPIPLRPATCQSRRAHRPISRSLNFLSLHTTPLRQSLAASVSGLFFLRPIYPPTPFKTLNISAISHARVHLQAQRYSLGPKMNSEADRLVIRPLRLACERNPLAV